jgi:hypothetical protein
MSASVPGPEDIGNRCSPTAGAHTMRKPHPMRSLDADCCF